MKRLENLVYSLICFWSAALLFIAANYALEHGSVTFAAISIFLMGVNIVVGIVNLLMWLYRVE